MRGLLGPTWGASRGAELGHVLVLMGVLGGRWTPTDPGDGDTLGIGQVDNHLSRVHPKSSWPLEHFPPAVAADWPGGFRLDVSHRKKDSLRALHLTLAWRGPRGGLCYGWESQGWGPGSCSPPWRPVWSLCPRLWGEGLLEAPPALSSQIPSLGWPGLWGNSRDLGSVSSELGRMEELWG